MTNRIVFIDTETTGITPEKDRIVQVAVFSTDLNLTIIDEPIESLINPEVPIPLDSTEVHQITDDMVQGAPLFKDVATGLMAYIGDAHIAGYNVRFDLRILIAELERAGMEGLDMSGRMILDPYVVLTKMEPRDQSSVYEYYTGSKLVGAHDAKTDILATRIIMMNQSIKYGFNNLEEMHSATEPEKTIDLAGKFIMKGEEPYFNFGPHFGKPVSQEPGFLNWMLGKEFSSDTKRWAEIYLQTKA